MLSYSAVRMTKPVAGPRNRVAKQANRVGHDSAVALEVGGLLALGHKTFQASGFTSYIKIVMTLIALPSGRKSVRV
jgi:hypothetical protein